MRDLNLRIARQNPRRGYQRIRGEVLSLGHSVTAGTLQALLRRHRVPPAPRRAALAWPAFLRAQAAGLVACDFFSVEMVRSPMLYVAIEIDGVFRHSIVAPSGE